MYKPVPPRPKKTDIVRSRTGCTACRKRRSKCDEKKPTCGRCFARARTCEYKQRFEFRYSSAVSNDPKPTDAPEICANVAKRAVTVEQDDQGSDPRKYSHKPCDRNAYTEIETGLETVQRPHHECSDDWAPHRRGGFPSALPEQTVLADLSTTLRGFLLHGSCSLLAQPSPGFVVDDRSPGSPDNITNPFSRNKSTIDVLEFQPLFSSSAGDSSSPMAPIMDREHEDSIDSNDVVDSDATPLSTTTGFARPSHAQLLANFPSVTGPNSQLDGSYFAHWQNNVLRVLPPVFQELSTVLCDHRLMRNAVLAIAACNLGRSWPELILDSSDEPLAVASYRPSHQHQYHSQAYYMSAMSDFVCAPEPRDQADTILTLATLLLFSYIEIGTGSFGGFCLHLRGAEKLISRQIQSLASNSAGKKLIGVWARLRSYQWCHQSPSPWSDFQNSLDLLSARHPIFWAYDMRRESILQILAESYHLSCQLLLARVHRERRPAEAVQPGLDANTEMIYLTRLRDQRGLLARWHGMLKLSDLPVESFTESRVAMTTNRRACMFREPLKFQSLESAMNYSYYICSHVLQDLDFLNVKPAEGGPTTAESDGAVSPWIIVLLRIAAGLGNEDCAHQNAYTVGLATLLLICALRSDNLLVGCWISDWLSRFQSLSIFEEGGVPILQALDIVQTINREKAKGRVIFYATDSDGEDGLRLESYSCQNITSLEVFGRDHLTSKYFHEHIRIQP